MRVIRKAVVLARLILVLVVLVAAESRAGTWDPSSGAPDWCAGHALPESACTKCNPELESKFRAAGDWCAEHAFPESVCPFCNPQQPPGATDGAASVERQTVRLATRELEGVAGIRTALAVSGEASTAVACTGSVAFDPDRVAEVRSVVPGIVDSVSVELGDRVAAGDPLFVLVSTRVSELQAQLGAARESVRSAEANLERQQRLRGSEISSARQVELARRELAAARSEAQQAESLLRLAGASTSGSDGKAIVRAPASGTVIRRAAILGSLAGSDVLLATIVDNSVMWVICNVAEAQASRLTAGQKAHVRIEDALGMELDGVVAWIDAEIDPRSRTIATRVEVENSDGKLRANQFVRARIETEAVRAAVAIPRSALQRVEDRDVVFVRTGNGVYRPRVVRRVGRADADAIYVEGDLLAGDEVVTTGAVLLRTELLPGSIGAGCCETTPPGGD